MLKSLGLALLPHLVLLKPLLLIDPKCLCYERRFLLLQQDRVGSSAHFRRTLAGGAAAKAALCELAGHQRHRDEQTTQLDIFSWTFISVEARLELI